MTYQMSIRQRRAAACAEERKARGVCIDCGSEKPPKRQRMLLCAPCQQQRSENLRSQRGSDDYRTCDYCQGEGHYERTCPIKAEEIDL